MNNLTVKTITALKFLIVFTLAYALVLSHAEQVSAQRRSSKQRVSQSGKQSTARSSTLITAQNFKPQITAQIPEGWFGKESITIIGP